MDDADAVLCGVEEETRLLDLVFLVVETVRRVVAIIVFVHLQPECHQFTVVAAHDDPRVRLESSTLDGLEAELYADDRGARELELLETQDRPHQHLLLLHHTVP